MGLLLEVSDANEGSASFPAYRVALSLSFPPPLILAARYPYFDESREVGEFKGQSFPLLSPEPPSFRSREDPREAREAKHRAPNRFRQVKEVSPAARVSVQNFIAMN